MRSRSTALLACVALLGAAGAAQASAASRHGHKRPVHSRRAQARPAAPRWSSATKLGTWQGGEPSLAFDPSGNGSVYVVAPQGIPTGLSAVTGGPATNGIGFWASHDHGRTFPITANIGSGVGGGDSDVEVSTNHDVFVTDLEAAATSICRSHNGGRSFEDAATLAGSCSTVNTGQTGPDNDRQWLNHGPHGEPRELYLTYHDFAANVPLMYRSTDNGSTWAPCGNILGSGPAQSNFVPVQGGDLVAKPVVDQRDGSVYVGVTEPDPNVALTTPTGAPLGDLYIAVARGGCTGTTSFETHTVYANPGADLAKDFDAIAEDGAGTLYMVATGKLTADQVGNAVYVFTSKDHGTTWSAPQRVSSPTLSADAMPAIAAGKRAGQVAVGWFGSNSPTKTENDVHDQWRYYVATSTTAGRTWQASTVTPQVIHYGDICTSGIFCSVNGGDRNLADFSSLSVDPATGGLLAVFPGDPQNRPDLPNGPNDFSSSAYVARQVGGTLLR